MGLLAEKLLNFFHRNSEKNSKNGFIFYKIVDSAFENEEECYKIQCINTKAIFNAKMEEIVFDTSILYSLHPIQACYIGIEYAQYLNKKNNKETISEKKQKQLFNHDQTHRYGNYQLCFQDRKGKVCFKHTKTNKEFLMDPRDIALSKELIEDFDASQAFYIGLLAGIKLHNPTAKHEASNTAKKPNLRLIICKMDK